MVLKVMRCTPSASIPLSYNVNKVERGDATLLGVRNIPSTDYGDINRTLLYRESLATNTRKPSIHIMISADKNEGENLTNGQALELIDKEMASVGLGDQPYVVFKHEDTDKDHFHIVSTKILPNGKSVLWNGIGKRMINELMRHEKKYGYIAGRNLHKVKLRLGKGEGVYRMVKDKFEKLLAGSNYYSYKEFRAYARDCKLDIRKRQSKSVDRKILIVNRLGDDGKRIGRPVYLTGNEAERVTEAIANNYNGIKTVYNDAFIPMTKGNVSLITIKNNLYSLMSAAKEAGHVVTKDCNAKYNELQSIWNRINSLNQERKEAKDQAEKAQSMIGMLALLNPIIALTVMFLAKISYDIRQSSIEDSKKKLLAQVVYIRDEIVQLKQRKAQLTIEKKKLHQEYLYTKQMLKEYQESLHAIDHNINAIKADIESVNNIERICKYVNSQKAENLLDYVNSAFGTFESHEHLVPGPLVQTERGMRWELYSDGYTDGKDIYQPHAPAPVKYGKSYIDFFFNERGQLVAEVEADRNYYTKGVSGQLNIDTGEGEVKERAYRGLKDEYRKKARVDSNTGKSKRPAGTINKGRSL